MLSRRNNYDSTHVFLPKVVHSRKKAFSERALNNSELIISYLKQMWKNAQVNSSHMKSPVHYLCAWTKNGIHLYFGCSNELHLELFLNRMLLYSETSNSAADYYNIEVSLW